jgi:hypothetical protein
MRGNRHEFPTLSVRRISMWRSADSYSIRSCDRSHPSAARSIREGLDETLTLTPSGVDGALYKTLRSGSGPGRSVDSVYSKLDWRELGGPPHTKCQWRGGLQDGLLVGEPN